jgi:hypothetical protein
VDRPCRTTGWILAGLAGLLLAGCAGAPARPPGPGSTPRIANLAIPAIAWANVPYEITFDFVDQDGDIREACFSWAWADARDEKCFPADMAGAADGTYRWRLTTRRAGLYYFSVQVRDARGHRSNILAKTLDIR